MKRMMMLALVALTTRAHSFADDFTTAGYQNIEIK